MNHLVHLDARAGELEKILSGVKTMVIKEFDPELDTKQPVKPGDSLYFRRDQDECAVRVKATIVRVLFITNHLGKGLSHVLKEMQPKLQFTEDQYNYWSGKQQVFLVEFGAAQKISLVQVATNRHTDPSNWIAFKDLGLITE